MLLHRTRFRRILCYCSWHHYMPKLAKQMVMIIMIRRHKHKLALEDCLWAHISSRLKPHVAFRLVGQKTTDLTQEGPTCVRTFLNIRQDEVAGKKTVTNECPQSPIIPGFQTEIVQPKSHWSCSCRQWHRGLASNRIRCWAAANILSEASSAMEIEYWTSHVWKSAHWQKPSYLRPSI